QIVATDVVVSQRRAIPFALGLLESAVSSSGVNMAAAVDDGEVCNRVHLGTCLLGRSGSSSSSSGGGTSSAARRRRRRFHRSLKHVEAQDFGRLVAVAFVACDALEDAVGVRLLRLLHAI